MTLHLDPYGLGSGGAPPPAVPVPSVPEKKPGLLRRFWGMATYSFGLSIGVMVALAIWQHNAPEGWRLSQLYGNFEGDVKAAEIATQLEAERAKNAALLAEQTRMQQTILVTQAWAQQAVAAAQSRAQQEVIVMQTKGQILAQAYQSLYERANQLAMLYAQTGQGVVQARIDLARANQGGNILATNVADAMKWFGVANGNERMVEGATNVRTQSIEVQMRDIEAAAARPAPQIDPKAFLAQGLPDPAQAATRMTLAPQAAFPAPPPILPPPPTPVNPYQKSGSKP